MCVKIAWRGLRALRGLFPSVVWVNQKIFIVHRLKTNPLKPVNPVFDSFCKYREMHSGG